MRIDYLGKIAFKSFEAIALWNSKIAEVLIGATWLQDMQ